MDRRNLLKSFGVITFSSVLPTQLLSATFPNPHSPECVCGAQFKAFDANLPEWLGKIRFTGWKDSQQTLDLAAQWFTVSPMPDGCHLYASVSHYPDAGHFYRGQHIAQDNENPFSLLSDDPKSLADLAQNRIRLGLIRLLGLCVEYNYPAGRGDDILAINKALSAELK